MAELFSESPVIFVAVAFAFALTIGSFLNVVIYRLPIMMQREWREQWPPLNVDPAGGLRTRPLLIEITIELADLGVITRLFEVSG